MITLGFQFLGIPPKGEHGFIADGERNNLITRMFPISRDPPEGGTFWPSNAKAEYLKFPISRDPPEGGTRSSPSGKWASLLGFQFLGIPPKGELLPP